MTLKRAAAPGLATEGGAEITGEGIDTKSSEGRKPPSGSRLDWARILAEGAAIVRSYSTAVTLRQLHYRLVSAAVDGYRNDDACYKALSSRTAELRRAGEFPSLAENGRSVDRPFFETSPAQALNDIASIYRLDRTLGQRCQTWLVFEKATLSAQFRAWTRPYGLPIAALRGYSSESLERQMFARMAADGRPLVGYYVGDLDPEGEDVERNFLAQADRAGITFERWARLAVTPAQIGEFGLVPNPGKPASSRAAGFVARHGDLFQIETEAVDPGVLERLVVDAVTSDDVFDAAAWDAVREAEAAERGPVEPVRGELGCAMTGAGDHYDPVSGRARLGRGQRRRGDWLPVWHSPAGRVAHLVRIVGGSMASTTACGRRLDQMRPATTLDQLCRPCARRAAGGAP